MQIAAGVWSHCRLAVNTLCWARQSAVVGRQHSSQMGFSVHADINSIMWVIATSMSGVCSDCCFVSVLAAILPRPYSDKATLIGKKIRWLVCMVNSKNYLRVCDVDQVLGDGRTTVTVHEVYR
jgi:hypothetical protein